MIRPEQLVQALDRIHPRDRELLSLSLRRRVPDEALAQFYDCPSTDVARRRARAIERLADELDLQRGEDLGAVLKALLEPETWSSLGPPPGEEFATTGTRGRLAPVPDPEDTATPSPEPALSPVPRPPEHQPEADSPAEPASTRAQATPATAASPADPGPSEPPASAPPPTPPPAAESSAAGSPSPGAPPPAEAPAAESSTVASTRTQAPAPPATANGAPPPDRPSPHPFSDMVSAREREVPDPPRRAVPLALFGLGVAALVGAAGVVGATQFGDTSGVVQSVGGDGGGDTRPFVPEEGGPLAAPFPTDPSAVSCYSTAYLPRATVLYREPGGRRRFKLTARTEWGSARILGVVEQRGGWLGVQAPELRNGELAWIRRREARVDCVRWSLHADLSKRVLFVRRDGRTVRKMNVAVGRPQNPTPKGRFTVTDKLRVTDGGSPYGCCVLALTGHQTNLPPYWPGGDRLAVHATSDESSIGQPVSLGCMRAEAPRARWLIETIPLGAPVFIRS